MDSDPVGDLIKESSHLLSDSYKNGREAGILECETIILNIMNNANLQITSIDLMKEFLKRTERKKK